MQDPAVEAVEQAAEKRSRYMKNIYWFALHGKNYDTPERET